MLDILRTRRSERFATVDTGQVVVRLRSGAGGRRASTRLSCVNGH